MLSWCCDLEGLLLSSLLLILEIRGVKGLAFAKNICQSLGLECCVVQVNVGNHQTVNAVDITAGSD